MDYKDFPKIHSPFVRKEINGNYIVTPTIDQDYNWVFGDDSICCDKLDGTNIAILVEDGKIKKAWNRKNVQNIIDINGTGLDRRILEGVNEAMKKGWMKEGLQYGELIGEKINTNRHKIKGHLFVPFDYLKESCSWRSWEEGKYPKTYEAISDWFKELPSLFNQKGKREKVLAEGLVFYDKQGRMAKLRRDMFDWYKGRRH